MMDISILQFYRYIGNISTDILTQNIDGLKIDQNLQKRKKKEKKFLKMKLEI